MEVTLVPDPIQDIFAANKAPICELKHTTPESHPPHDSVTSLSPVSEIYSAETSVIPVSNRVQGEDVKFVGIAAEDVSPLDVSVAAVTQAPFIPSLGAWAKPLKILIPSTPPASPRKEAESSIPHGIHSSTLWPSLDAGHGNALRSKASKGTRGKGSVVLKPKPMVEEICASRGLINAVVNRIWGKKCRIFTRKLGEYSYLFHIPDDSTRTWILQRGLWHVDDCLMFVAAWSPTTTLSLPEISTAPVWVTLKNIPNSLYSRPGISRIASGLGEPMLTNKQRLDPTLMGETKILVEIELDKPFPQRIACDDEMGIISIVDVEYSWIPSKCVRCGHLGHKEPRCLQQSFKNLPQASYDKAFTITSVPISVSDQAVVSVPAAVSVPASFSGSVTHVAGFDPSDSNPTMTDLTIGENAPLNVSYSTVSTTTLIPALEQATTITAPVIVTEPITPTIDTAINVSENSTGFVMTESMSTSETAPIINTNAQIQCAVIPASDFVFSTPSAQSRTPQITIEEEAPCVLGGNHFAALENGVPLGFELVMIMSKEAEVEDK